MQFHDFYVTDDTDSSGQYGRHEMSEEDVIKYNKVSLERTEKKKRKEKKNISLLLLNLPVVPYISGCCMYQSINRCTNVCIQVCSL